ncbi:MAG: hypothetical protein EAX96_13200 [Candidatus Lokiarchaeota archaeon]|nr:hypothetical protein [Candidatus Lokiarchaeota archaeon]
MELKNITIDIKKIGRVEENLLFQNKILNSIYLERHLISENDLEVYKICLSVAEELRNNKFGLIGLLNYLINK